MISKKKQLGVVIVYLLPDSVLKPGHAVDELGLLVGLLPEGFELTHLQQVGQVQDCLHVGVLKNILNIEVIVYQ